MSLSITPTSLPHAAFFQPYSQALAASGGTGPYTWSVSSGTLFAGFTLNASTGVISGTALSLGFATFTVKVTDSLGATGTQSLTLTVDAGSANPLEILTTSLPDSVVGSSYSQVLSALGGTEYYNWTVTTGALPDGLDLESLDGGFTNGGIVGTPTTTGTFNFTLQVTDSTTPEAQTSTKAFSIKIGLSGGADFLFDPAKSPRGR